jgi:hypothetical protein
MSSLSFLGFQLTFVCLMPINQAMVMDIGRQHELRLSTKTGNRLSFWRWKKIRFDNRNKIIDWTKGECFAISPDRMACRTRSEECWSCGAFLTADDNQQGRIGSKRYEGREDLLRWSMIFGTNQRLGSLVSHVLKLRSFHRLEVGIEHLDSSRIKIIIFILLISFNHSTCNARPIRPHKIKRVAYYCRLYAVGGKIVLNKHILMI